MMEDTTFKAMQEKLGDYGIYRYLDISTGHITKSDRDLLKAGIDLESARIIGTYEEGYVLSLMGWEGIEEFNGWKEDDLAKGYSEAFYDLLEYAQRQGCILMRLDADGMEFSEFPTFDW